MGEKNSERDFTACFNSVRSLIYKPNHQHPQLLLFNSTYARCRLGYHGVLTRDPLLLQLAKEPLLLFYVKLKHILRLLLSFMEHTLIPPSPHTSFHSRYFLAMNPQMFYHSYHHRTQQKNPAYINYQYHM